MLPADEFKEKKVQDALALLQENPGMKATITVQQTCASYYWLIRWLQGILCSSSWEGHNKKLDEPSTEALKDYLLMCYSLGKGASINNIITSANSIPWCNSLMGTVSQK